MVEWESGTGAHSQGRPHLEVRWEPRGPATALVTLDGELELFTEQEVRRLTEHLRELGIRHLVVDLSAVNFIDSAGISLFVWLYRRFRNDGTVALSDPGARHRDALNLVRLPQLIPVFPSVEEALLEVSGSRDA